MTEQGPIIQLGRNAWKASTPDAAGLLVDARDYYRAFYAAALEAESSILLSGWQFDTGVQLLRGEDVPDGAETHLLKFLNQLCERRPNLEIYVLAWDFHVVFALEREWMQRILFHWMTNERLHFRFDETAANGGSHHQKFAVIDRRVAFLGGIDLCEARWDDRRHLAANPSRTSRGEPVKPYHDVQAYMAGCEVTDTLRQVFMDRWARTKGPTLKLAECEVASQAGYRPDGALLFPRSEVAFSRTDPKSEHETVREVERLFTDAIAAAEQLIYVETQYFSSRAICDALVARLSARDRSRIELVMILNEKAEALKEELAVGLRQTKNLEQVRAAAHEFGHGLGIFYSMSEGSATERRATYIHSKLLLVDDAFLSVGSANLTNRSMGVDTELHVSWEAPPDRGDRAERDRLCRAIRRVRVSLLAEHAGVQSAEVRALVRPEGLAQRLGAIADRKESRLERVPPPTETEADVLDVIDPEALPFDPQKPTYDAAAEFAAEQHAARSLFVGGVSALWEKLKS